MYRAAVLTISDTRSTGENPDRSGPAAAETLERAGLSVGHRETIPDERERIEEQLRSACAGHDLVVTTGGTGVSLRDVTPEAVAAVVDRVLPGFGEIMRTGTFAKTPLSIISRSGAGLAGRTLVVWLPGSERAVRECLELVLPAIRHVMEVMAKTADCAVAQALAGRGGSAG